MLINVLKGDDEHKRGGYPFSGLSWPLCLLKWSVRPWPIMSSLIIISRYSACLSGRSCYQRTTHSEDERGINTQAFKSHTYSQGPVSLRPKSFISAYDSWLLLWFMRENLGDQPKSNHCCLWYNLKRRLVFGLAASVVKVWLVSMVQLASAVKCMP